MSIVPTTGRTTLPTPCTGEKPGVPSGEGKGAAVKTGGGASPASTTGLVSLAGDGSSARRSLVPTSPGSAPRIVPVHSGGTLVDALATQLFVPVTRRPVTHAASTSRKRFTGPPPRAKKTFECISTLSSPSKRRNTAALAPGATITVLNAKR